VSKAKKLFLQSFPEETGCLQLQSYLLFAGNPPRAGERSAVKFCVHSTPPPFGNESLYYARFGAASWHRRRIRAAAAAAAHQYSIGTLPRLHCGGGGGGGGGGDGKFQRQKSF
jgi:hypothetical protein